MLRKAYPDQPILDVRQCTSYYYRLWGLMLFAFCFLAQGNAQTVLLQESFETDGEGTRYTSNSGLTLPPTGNDTWIRTDQNPAPNHAFSITAGARNGSYYWAGEAVSDVALNGGADGVITLNAVSVSGFSSLDVQIALGISRFGEDRWERVDMLRVEYNMDGSGWNIVGLFRGDNPTNDFTGGGLSQDTDNNEVTFGPYGTEVTGTFADFTLPIPVTGNSLQVRVRGTFLGSEEVGFDNIRIRGIATSNNPPVLASIEGSNVSYSEGDPAVQITNTVTVTDPDDINIESATVQVTTNFDATEDLLAFTPSGGITGSYNPITGILSLSGISSLANYQTLLRSVTYQNTDLIDASAATRTIAFQVNDGTDNSNIVTRNIDISTSLNTTPAALPFCESFETDGEGTRYGSNHFSSGCTFAERGPAGTNVGGCFAEILTGADSSFVFNTESANANGGLVLTSQPLDISSLGAASITIEILLAVSRDDEDRWENTDQVRIEYSIDGGAYIIAGLFTGSNPNPIIGSDLFEDLDQDPGTLGPFSATAIPDVFTNYSFNFTGSGSTITYRVVVNSTGTEELAFDKICVSAQTSNTAPTAICRNVTVDADANCQGTTAAASFDGGSSDPENDALTFSVSLLGPYPLGTTDVVLTASDGSLQDTCHARITVEDNTDPTAICQDITIYSDQNGNASITAAQIDNGSGDNCGSVSLSVDKTDFVCDMDPFMNTVTLTVDDGNGNSSTCTAIVTVQDTVPPLMICKDITVELDASGQVRVFDFDVDDGSYECNILFAGGNSVVYTCDSLGQRELSYTIIPDDGNDNGVCTGIVTVVDNLAPDAVCQDFTVQLDVNGTGSLTGSDIDGGSSDNCSINLSPSRTTFGCADKGMSIPVTLTVSDNSGNESDCIANVTVEDNIAPNAVCQDISVYLNGTGNANITAVDIDGGSSDNCGIASFGIDISSFTCADFGANVITFTVTDSSGNQAGCNATVTVLDSIPPTAVCQDITVFLDATGNASISTSQIDGGSTDNCAAVSLSASQTNFNCGQEDQNVAVTLTVTDASTNMSSCIANVMVQDTIPPVAVCQDITVYLDGTGNVSIDPDDIHGNSTDSCGFTNPTIIIGQSSFTCSNLGPNLVELRVGDGNGNQDTCSATVTVVDTVAPVALCNDIMVYLNGSGFATIPSTINNSSIDNCGVDSFATSPPILTCDQLGTNPMTLFVFDASGNVSSCTSMVTVLDSFNVCNQPPIAVCQDITVDADANCQGTAIAANFDGGSSDPDGDDLTFSLSPMGTYGLGTTSVVLTVSDGQEQDTCHATITVVDNTDPTISCPADITVDNDPGECGAVVNFIIDFADNCPGATLVVNPESGSFFAVGTNAVNATVTDAAGNTADCSFNVTVNDNEDPVAPAPPADVVVQCADDVPPPVDLTAQDNCDGPITVSPSAVVTPGECANQFTEVRTWTFTDAVGNSSSVSQTITVNDTERPTFDRPRPPRNVEASCGQIPPVPVVTASDNCDDEVEVTFEQTDNGGAGFEYDPLIIERVWTAMDDCGNTRRRRQTITVIDCLDPCNIEGITVGSTTTRMMAGPVCNGDGTYDVEICIQWKGNPMPDFIEVEINGTGGFIQIPIDGPQDYPEKCFTLENLPANGRNVMIFARIGREGCTYRARDLFRAPDRCDPPPTECDITGANVQIEPTCDNGTVSTCIMIEGALLPQDASNARAFVGGQPVEITQYTLVTGGAVVCFQGLRADGGSKDFFFQAEPGCSITKRGFLRMPRSCDGDPGDDDDDDCDITGMRNPVVNCDGNGTYSLTFDVTYNDMPNGQLAVEVGHGANKTWSYYAVTGSPQTITVAGLPAVGGYANVFIKSNDARGCTWYERSWYRAPADCGRGRDGEFTTNLDQVRVYPNPSAGQFFLLIEQDKIEMIEVAVSNAVGQVVKTIKVESNREEVLDLEGMPEGIYTLRIMQGEVPVYRQVQVQR